MSAADGLGGFGLLSAEGGVWWAVLVIVITGLPAVLAGAGLLAAGNPLTAPLAVALAGALTLGGTSLLGAAQRADAEGGLPSLYSRLGLELVGWMVLWAFALAGMQLVGRWLGPRVPARLRSEHLGEGVSLLGVDGPSLGAGVLTGVVGGGLSWVLIASHDPWQAMGGLILGFAVGGLVGHSVLPRRRFGAALASPGMVGVVIYLRTGWLYPPPTGADALLEAVYTQQLPGLAMALPVHYATAGVVGVCLGLGAGQVIEKAQKGV